MFIPSLSGRAFLHKSEWGGVITSIRNGEELRLAYEAMMRKVRERDPGVAVGAVQVQEQIQGRELLMGLKRIPSSVPSSPAAWGASMRRS